MKAPSDNPETPIEQMWFSTSQAAKYLGMKPDALRKQIERGNLVPDVWAGSSPTSRTHRFRRETLDRYFLQK